MIENSNHLEAKITLSELLKESHKSHNLVRLFTRLFQKLPRVHLKKAGKLDGTVPHTQKQITVTVSHADRSEGQA